MYIIVLIKGKGREVIMDKIKKQWRIYFGEVMGKPRLLAVNYNKNKFHVMDKKEVLRAFDVSCKQAEALEALLETDIADRFVEYSKRCGVTAIAGRIYDYLMVHTYDEVRWADIEHKTLLIVDETADLFVPWKEIRERQQSCVMFNIERVF